MRGVSLTSAELSRILTPEERSALILVARFRTLRKASEESVGGMFDHDTGGIVGRVPRKSEAELEMLLASARLKIRVALARRAERPPARRNGHAPARLVETVGPLPVAGPAVVPARRNGKSVTFERTVFPEAKVEVDVVGIEMDEAVAAGQAGFYDDRTPVERGEAQGPDEATPAREHDPEAAAAGRALGEHLDEAQGVSRGGSESEPQGFDDPALSVQGFADHLEAMTREEADDVLSEVLPLRERVAQVSRVMRGLGIDVPAEFLGMDGDRIGEQAAEIAKLTEALDAEGLATERLQAELDDAVKRLRALDGGDPDDVLVPMGEDEPVTAGELRERLRESERQLDAAIHDAADWKNEIQSLRDKLQAIELDRQQYIARVEELEAGGENEGDEQLRRLVAERSKIIDAKNAQIAEMERRLEEGGAAAPKPKPKPARGRTGQARRATAQGDANRQKVLAAVVSFGATGASLRPLVEAAGFGQTVVSRHLASLQESGEIRKAGHARTARYIANSEGG